MAININLNDLVAQNEAKRLANCKCRFADYIRGFAAAGEAVVGYTTEDLGIQPDEDIEKIMPQLRAQAKRLSDGKFNVVNNDGILIFVDETLLPEGPEYNFLRSPKRKKAEAAEPEAE